MMEIYYIFFCATILGLTGYAFQIWAIRKKLRESNIGEEIKSRAGESFAPPISILKPLKGLDDNLFDNLESICLQEYPSYEIIFSLQDYNDPAYKVAKKIQEKHPEKDITILVERCGEGLNPKVNNLIPACRIAKYDYILISDSNVMVNTQYLNSIIGHMADPDVGLVSNMIKGVGGRTLGSILENLHLNSFVMGSVCFLDRFLKMPCVVGKSMLMRRADLNAIGGLKAFKDMLAEDYLIGRNIRVMGKKVVLSNYLIRNVNHYGGIRKFLNRHTRWGKLRWNIGGVSYLSELIGNPVFMSILPVLIGEASRVTMSFALLVSSLKILGDIWISRALAREDAETRVDSPVKQNYCAPAINPLWYLLSPVKDCIIGIIWFIPLISKTVVWRDNRYIIGKDSQLSPCPDTGFWSLRYRLADAVRTRFV